MSGTMYIGDALELLFKEIKKLNYKVDQLIEKDAENNIEEISLCKAASRLHMGSETIKRLVASGQLKARTYKTNKGISYRFRICDIHRYQRAFLYDPKTASDKVKTPEEKRIEELQEFKGASEKLAERIFNLKSKRGRK